MTFALVGHCLLDFLKRCLVFPFSSSYNTNLTATPRKRFSVPFYKQIQDQHFEGLDSPREQLRSLLETLVNALD